MSYGTGMILPVVGITAIVSDVDIVIEMPLPAEPISMNEGDTWQVRGRVKEWRDAAYYAWCAAHPGVGPLGRVADCPAEVHVVIGFRQNRRRDPINYAKTVKHIVDGLVLAGAWPDDTEDYVTQHIPSLVHMSEPTVLIRVSPRALA